MNLIIREYRDEDFEGLMKCINVLKSFEGQYDEDYLTDEESEKVLFEEIHKPTTEDTGKIYIAEVDSAIVGFISFNIGLKNIPEIFRSVEALYISDIVVLEEFRGKGIASLLMEKADEYSKERKIKYIKLIVFGDNTSAVEVYKKKGFKNYEITMLKEVS